VLAVGACGVPGSDGVGSGVRTLRLSGGGVPVSFASPACLQIL